VKGFRIFDSGLRILNNALDVADKLDQSEEQSKVFYNWNADARALAVGFGGSNTFALIDDLNARFDQLLGSFETNMELLVGNEIVAKVAQAQFSICRESLYLFNYVYTRVYYRSLAIISNDH